MEKQKGFRVTILEPKLIKAIILEATREDFEHNPKFFVRLLLSRQLKIPFKEWISKKTNERKG